MTFTDGPTYTQLSAVDALTTGTLTYTSLSGTAAQLAANADSYVAGGVNITVTDAATIAQLAAIDTATTGTYIQPVVSPIPRQTSLPTPALTSPVPLTSMSLMQQLLLNSQQSML